MLIITLLFVIIYKYNAFCNLEVIKIFNRFIKNDDNSEVGFFFYEEDGVKDALNSVDEQESATGDTIFERVVARKKSEKREFKFRYLIIGAISVLVITLIALLADYLAVYKKNAPETLCEEIVASYNDNNPDVFVKNCTNLPKVLKNKNNLKEYFKSYLPKNEFKYYQVATDNKYEKKYVFKSGDTKIGEIVFKKRKKPASYNIEQYKVKEFTIVPLIEYRLNAYSGFTLLINDIPADNYLFSKNIGIEHFYEYLEEPITKDMYIINDVNYIKELKALDSDGKVYDVVSSISNFGYDITIKCDDKREELIEYFGKFIFEYMHYTVKDDRNPKPVLEYIHENSYICDELRNYVNWDPTRFDNERIENLKIEDLVYYGSGCYTCKVSADYVSEVKKETVIKSFKKTVYLLFNDGKYSIVDMIDYSVD